MNKNQQNSSAEQQNSPLLTEAQSAHRVGVSVSTFRRWRRKGIGPKFFLLGGILRYRSVDLDEFIARHTRQKAVV